MPVIMETIETNNVSETYALGRQLAKRFNRGDCVALIGQLGAGKTALIRGIALGLGLKDERLVSSPTFVLVQEYPADVKVFHIDLYRTRQAELELLNLGVDEMLQDGIVLIEWADKASAALPEKRWEIKIEATGRDSRRFTISQKSQDTR